MSQLASAAKPARTARQLKNIRETRKVKGAIRWHERQRERRKKMMEQRYDDKQVFQQINNWHVRNIAGPIKQARRNLREDYELGPLRPNRAVGPDAEAYGLITADQWKRPTISVDTHKRRNEARVARGLEPIYPLVAEDKKFFPIVEDDRVIVINGREKGKIGVVTTVLSESHQLVIQDINKRYIDGSIFIGESRNMKRESELPLSLEDVRLVIPYRITTKDKDGNNVDTWTDVAVDNIFMERHTTGVDPFTKVDYGTREFPEEHRFDPETGLPIFDRYIAGTRHRIQWPWETVLPEEESTKVTDLEPKQSLIGKLKSPIKTLKTAFTSKSRKNSEEQVGVPELTEEDKAAQRTQATLEQVDKAPELPRGPPAQLPADYEDDTGRNKAEPSPNTSSFYPTLVYPPFPEQLTSEIRLHAKEAKVAEREEKQDWYENPKEVSSEERAARKAAKAEKLRHKGVPDAMKTPLQLRWEVERAKQAEQKAKMKVDRKALMIALGAHIEAQHVARSPQKAEAEVD